MSRYFGFEPVETEPYYFISYNSQDDKRIGAIALEMHRRGIPMWYDKGLLSGEKWEQQIIEKIKGCHEVVLFVTKKLMARKSSYVKKEFRFANGFQKTVRIVVLDEIAFDDVSDELKNWFVDLKDLRGIYALNNSNPQYIVDTMDNSIHFLKTDMNQPNELEKRSTKAFNKKWVIVPMMAAGLLLMSVGIFWLTKQPSEKETLPPAQESEALAPTDFDPQAKEQERIQQQMEKYRLEEYDSFEDYIYVEVGDTVTIMGVKDKSARNLKIPPVIKDKMVTKIGDHAFSSYVSLESVEIPDTVNLIGYEAFRDCTSLKTVNLPESVTYIDDMAFNNCNALISLELPDKVTYIGRAAFGGCGLLTSINIPPNITSVNQGAFAQCSSLRFINIPEGVTSIGHAAFSGCKSAITITVPDSVKSIDTFAFCDCSSVMSMTIPKGITSIGEGTFWGCKSLRSLNVPSSVRNVDYSAFNECPFLTIHGKSGSYIQQVAQERNINFVAE